LDDTLRQQVRSSKGARMFVESSRVATYAAMRPGTVLPSAPQLKQYATTSVAAGRKPIPASRGLLEWERTAGFEGYSDAVSWAPIGVVIERHQHDESVMKIRAQEVADYQRTHR
jgi:hypothetical protein